jgi:hypothetical protein
MSIDSRRCCEVKIIIVMTAFGIQICDTVYNWGQEIFKESRPIIVAQKFESAQVRRRRNDGASAAIGGYR